MYQAMKKSMGSVERREPGSAMGCTGGSEGWTPVWRSQKPPPPPKPSQDGGTRAHQPQLHPTEEQGLDAVLNKRLRNPSN